MGPNTWEFILRLALSALLGGIIGLEREFRLKGAGIRTHLIVCFASCMMMLVSKYGFFDVIDYPDIRLDPSRIAAGLVTAIGFLGAGTIFARGRGVTGLTTAAGLWASACMGLAIGIGFYEAAVAACILILFVNSTLHRLDGYVISKSKVIERSVEGGVVDDISGVIAKMRQTDIRVSELEITKDANSSDAAVAATMLLRSTVRRDRAEILAIVSDVQGVKFVESI